MRNPFSYILSFFKVCFWKIKYLRKLSIGTIQSLECVKLKISGHSKVEIGKFNQNRGPLYIGVENGRLSIGNHCFFNINGSITCLEAVEIGNFCKFGNNLVIVDHDHNFKTTSPEFLASPIKIGHNVWVGANVIILRGTNIGDNCVIAAGSVVKGNIPENTIFVKDTFKMRERTI